ncbi:DUF4230 domain-containing protein [Neisseria canis]|uniref:DUF4230 domain-containing protein n=1 Tax=Neisseria canis TaxID=493 RepID=A0A1X3CX73_9NEIS|nr:DUF4230 domain-containing protein [Neisseria canis]OSI12054.1 hypothetical protein BWD07_07525 [Neisseria canis]VEF03156.1 Uncharacterised protein [Neisseria canis]
MKKLFYFLLIPALVCAGAFAMYLYMQQKPAAPKTVHNPISRESIIVQIHKLNRLESTAFYIDTIIKTEKQGNWYLLWQDAQTGLFMAKGRVLAGVDLDKLKPENVQVIDGKAIISLPPVEILSVNVDNLDVYDIKTGSLGITPIDKSVFQEVQSKARTQILESACRADILKHAQAQAQVQLETLFALTQTKVSVYPAALPVCKA